MRHRCRGRKLNRNSSHRKALMRNLARALILSPAGRIVTTTGKAKEVRPFVEKLVTLGRYGDEASRRRAVALLGEHAPSHPRAADADQKKSVKWARIPGKPVNPVDRKAWRRAGLPAVPAQAPVIAIERLFKEIAPKFKDRPGGYTRILKLSERRLNDNAEQVLLEFVVPVVEAPQAPEAKPKSKKKAKPAEAAAS